MSVNKVKKNSVNSNFFNSLNTLNNNNNNFNFNFNKNFVGPIKPSLYNNSNDTLVISDLFVSNNDSKPIFDISSVKKDNYNECFSNILKKGIASNSDDAKNGEFIAPENIKDEYWLKNKLSFDKTTNGTYLISVIKPDNRKIPLGYTNSETYNEYMKSLNLSIEKGSDINGGFVITKNGDNNYTKYYSNGVVIRMDENYSIIDNYNTTNNNNKPEVTKVENPKPKQETTTPKTEKKKPDNKEPEVTKVEKTKTEDKTSTNKGPEVTEVENSKQENNSNNTNTNTTVTGDLSKYRDTDATVGSFQVTTNNNTFSMSENDMIKVAAIIYGEAVENSYDDALGVASVMANRADSGRFGQSTLVGVATAPNQFHAYNGRKYNNFVQAYKNGNMNSGMQICLDAVKDVMNGVRNNTNYLFFTGHGSYTKYR